MKIYLKQFHVEEDLHHASSIIIREFPAHIAFR